jgi:hypothetical protein
MTKAGRSGFQNHPPGTAPGLLGLPDEDPTPNVSSWRISDFSGCRSDREFSFDFPGVGPQISCEPTEVKILPVELPLVRVPVGVITLKNRTLAPVARLFVEHAREIAKPLAKRK